MEFKLEDVYIKFVLLDLTAKIAPGAFCLISIFFALENILRYNFYSIISELAHISFWIWIIFIALSWIVGFAIQGLGEVLRLIKYGPTYHLTDHLIVCEKSDKKFDAKTAMFEKRTIEFNEFANDGEKIRYQRIVAIKEACGNGCVALLFSAIILFFSDGKYKFSHVFSDLYAYIFLAIIYIIFFILLWYMHIQQRNRQDDYYHLVKNKKRLN